MQSNWYEGCIELYIPFQEFFKNLEIGKSVSRLSIQTHNIKSHIRILNLQIRE